jgi:hypothetical protein
MATIYSRLKHYCKIRGKQMLTADQRCELGKIVLKNWFAQETLKYPITKAEVHEPEGTFVVLSYCKKFSPQIDNIIHEFYDTIPKPVEKKKRQRIAVPAYKGIIKPTSNNG